MMSSFPAFSFGTANTTFRNTIMLSTYSPFNNYISFANYDYGAYLDLAIFSDTVACNVHCDQTVDCIGYNMINNGICFLRAVSLLPTRSDVCSVSYKIQPQRTYLSISGIEYTGNDLAYYIGNIASCRTACDALPSCVAFV